VHLGVEAIEAEVGRLASGEFLCRIEAVAAPATVLLTPPEQISTTDCAARYRYIPDAEGSGASLWDPALTPYINGIQDAGDDPETSLIIVPKPGRVGGTVAGENMLFKRLKFGPLTDTLWYLASDSEVESYIDRTVAPLFALHPDIQAKVGRHRSDNKRNFKRVSGRILEYLQVNRKTITGRTGGFIAVDEVDSVLPKLRGTVVDQMQVRGTTLGNRFKGYLCSHMDAGWTSGIAAAWKESSRGIWYWPCPQCDGFSSPCPTAPKGWRMVLDYERPGGVSDDDMLDRVAATAGLKCPHCGKKAADVDKPMMLARGVWVHEGQEIAADGTVTGEPRSRRVMGFWIHGTMSPWVSWADLARRFVSALVVFERTKKSERLREVTAKVLGEVYEGGAGGGRVIDPIKLAARAEEAEADEHFEAGTFPRGALFQTAAIDVGGKKFDAIIVAWDLEGRSWIVDRWTMWQREAVIGGRRQMIDLRPGERQEDWIVLRDEVLRRLVPLQEDPDQAMRIAGVAIDTGGVEGVTPRAREFARRMHKDGESGLHGYRIRLIKGGTAKNAPEVGAAREINKDDEGKAMVPSVREFTLNVDKLKAQVLERLATDEDGPGYVRFGDGLPRSVFEELCGEVFIDGKFERRGANETLDLFGYAEAARAMLQPEREAIKWAVKRPIWARPVPAAANGEALPPEQETTKQRSAIERMAALNRRSRN
jgi:phage terminase large subunit GpA-like protein